MKKYLIRRVLTTNLALLFFAMLHAQDSLPYDNPAYGPDSSSRIRCAAELSTMSEYMKIKLYDYALPSWRSVYRNCPGSSKNIYINGVKIFRNKIEKAEDPGEKAALFDTLMMIYDHRIEYFGEEGYVLGRKGIDIIHYNDKAYDKAYEAFLKSAQLMGEETDLNVILGLTQTGAVMMKAGKIDARTFLDNYLMSRGLLSKMLNKGESSSRITRASDMMDKVVGGAAIQDCDVIEQVFSDKVNGS
ncbi:MAG TPA: hypothetical protein VE870_11075, partial [Bacteroidales bacterium]|nr:hypothetical protein [Bacteroidales bacterium]